MPDRKSLEKFKTSTFRGTEKDISDKIAVLKALMPRGRVLDYGCSWGYGTFQLIAADYDAIGFEISQPRAAFGRARLGVKIISGKSALDGLAQSFDAVFASPVLEQSSRACGRLRSSRESPQAERVTAGFRPQLRRGRGA